MTTAPEQDILETTLRDGNYVVDFKFTATDTAWMAGALEHAGIRFIEIGHGIGIGASRHLTPAAESDRDYIRAARTAVKSAKIGMFLIPALADLDDLRMAKDEGLDFVRIGADVDAVDSMAPFVELGRELDMFVCTNIMKSYCLSPEDFGSVVHRTETFGSEMNYLVDSAGGMMPADVALYIEAMKDATTVPFGFHGHDNTRMATANTLVAYEAGAYLIDTTLFGIGRGSGNAATELMASIIKKRWGGLTHLDEHYLLQLADVAARPLATVDDEGSISMALGLAQVHSMYLKKIDARAKAEGLDIKELIFAVGRIDRMNVTEAILDAAVEQVRASQDTAALPEGGFYLAAGE